MFLRILLFTTLLCLISCRASEKPISHKRILEQYISALNESNFERVSGCVSDSLRVEELDFLLSDNMEDFYRMFQWDSVFNPHFELIDMQENDQGLQITVSKRCRRIQYLLDTALITRGRLEIAEGKIIQFQTYDFLNMDFSKWESRRDTLVAWIGVNHPELNGFQFDQSIRGGQNYLKAIDLYTNRPQL